MNRSKREGRSRKMSIQKKVLAKRRSNSKKKKKTKVQIRKKRDKKLIQNQNLARPIHTKEK